MRTAGNQIESPVLVLNADSLPSAGMLIRNDSVNGHPFGFVIRDQTSKIRFRSLRVGQNPGATVPLDIANGAVAFLLKLLTSALKSAIQFVETIFCLLDISRY